jgi:uncharacterized membrane protein
MTLVVPSAAHFTEANGNNEAGDVVGDYFDDADGRVHGYLLSDGTYRIFDEPHGARGTHPHDINSSGDVVGTYVDAGNMGHGFLLHGGKYTTIDVP